MTSSLSQSTTMPPPYIPLTLIVATTPSLGIGLKGTLPWPPLKSDLAFFARVTKRVPPLHSQDLLQEGANSGSRNIKNAVIMGRKTWESIPPKFRPLKDRINVVITRSPDGLRSMLEGQKGDVFATPSIEDALKELKSRFPSRVSDGSDRSIDETAASAAESGPELGRLFVIGGSEIYRLALKATSCERVLWTRLENEFECDTFFPEEVLPVRKEILQSESPRVGAWTATSKESLQTWTGEADAGEDKQDGDVRYRVMMLEKKDAGSHD